MPYSISVDARPEDLEAVRTLLGREPLSGFVVVVRDEAGAPVVIRNEPFLQDGTPMPTRFWLVGAAEIARVGRLEAQGGVKAAEAAVGAEALSAAHERYREMRDRTIPETHEGPRPSGGVGGTREGVKCLHAHYAWFLAGGDDPVGAWVQQQLDIHDARITLRLEAEEVTITSPRGWHHRLGSTPAYLQATGLATADPPHPADLTNALGSVEDDLVEMLREHADLPATLELELTGTLARSLAQVEIGLSDIPAEVEIARDAMEEVFRVLATEAIEDRAFNPGLPADHVELIVAAACVAVSALRTLGLDRVRVV